MKNKKKKQQLNTQEPFPLHIAITFGYTALALTLLNYFGKSHFFIHHFPEYRHLHYGLLPHLWWALTTITLFLLPMLIVRYVFKHRLSDYGFNIRIKAQHLLFYVGIYLFMLPLIFYASTRADFQSVYPFFKQAHQAPLQLILIWEAAYLLQFFALEFFFRGFLVLGLERHIGRAAVYIAMAPYCMIHFNKPLLETLGAIIAGIALGELARYTRTIFGGVLIHMAVALTMDVLALNK